ncbi:MAG: DNA polymerase III subunit gamma/tau [Planctomycetota bacterium]
MTDSQPTHYQVIARRYRPKSFEEVVGQEATAQTLKQAILQQRTAHAYLFCGPRGVGKTSMARIFARSLQCPEAKNAEPCHECATCDRIFRGEDDDVQEMDGASHRGIDDVRDLIQHVRYAPAHGDYRIFIIDEVHMLTREAFNALLKTLEEPPSHVIFVFATTEPEKLPPTVLSRCQRCDFSPISNADIVRRLQQICDAEGAAPEEGVLVRVADFARGGMRDSQSLLDQLLSFSENKPTHADLDFITGRLAPEQIRTLVDEIDAGDRSAVVLRLQEIERGGTDPSVLLEQVMEELRSRLHRGVEEGWGNTEIERNLLAQEILQEARMRTRQLSRAEVVLELALLRMATLSDLVPLEALAGGEGGAGHTAHGPAGPPTTPSKPNPPSKTRTPSSSKAPSKPTASEPTASDSTASDSRRPKASSKRPTASASPRPEVSDSVTAASPPASTAAPPADVAVAADAPPATPRQEPAVADANRTAAASDGDDVIAVVRRALEQAAPMLARSVGEGIAVGGDRVTLTVASSSFASDKIGVCERAISSALGRSVTLSLTEPTNDPEDEDGPAEVLPPVDADAPPPAIVEKAQEIFRGSVQASVAPPRNSQP